MREVDGLRFYEHAAIDGLELPFGVESREPRDFAIHRRWVRNPAKLLDDMLETCAEEEWDRTGKNEFRDQWTRELYPEEHPDLFRRFERRVLAINRVHFGLDLTYWHPMRLNQYRAGEGGHLAHSDVSADAKIAFSLILRRAEKGGELVLWEHEAEEFGEGDLVVFPAFTVHEVKPVERGERVSLTGWMGGPRLR